MSTFDQNQTYLLQTDHTTYAFAVNADGRTQHLYWGPKIADAAGIPSPVIPTERSSFDMPHHQTPEEYSGYGGVNYTDPSLKISFGDPSLGTTVRDLDLRFFEASQIDDHTLRITLRDQLFTLSVDLHYRAHPKYDLIERWVSIRNDSDLEIQVERVVSARWILPIERRYDFHHMHGRHAEEFQRVQEPLTYGIKRIESKRVTTSHHHAPWWALEEAAGEEFGEVWFGTLAWSGNWMINAEVTDYDSTRVSVGWNDWDSAYKLKKGAVATTPSAFAGYTGGGFGAASRQMHAYVNENILPHKGITHPVLYNSWEATYFDVDETSQIELAKKAAAMGVELFVMDDGWFHNRVVDNAGLGDWRPDAKKFPNGLGGLISAVKKFGMDFGLWLEPEMVNPDSDLYRAHPDWVISFPNRPRTEARGQLILNLAMSEVQAYLVDTIAKLLAEYDISFIKWDMNRNISEPGWQTSPGDARELWVRYTEGVYAVWGELARRFPTVIWQSCSGGGGRADWGILRYADQVWISDNTEAVSRLSIQEGFTQFMPASVMEAWVTDWGAAKVPLGFRFDVSMSGILGIGGNLNHWREDELTLAAEKVALYKTIRHLIVGGDLYRLLSPREGAITAAQYTAKDGSEAVVFVYRVFQIDLKPVAIITPRGLVADRMYRVDGQNQIRSGEGWMNSGFRVTLGNLESKIIKIEAV